MKRFLVALQVAAIISLSAFVLFTVCALLAAYGTFLAK